MPMFTDKHMVLTIKGDRHDAETQARLRDINLSVIVERSSRTYCWALSDEWLKIAEWFSNGLNWPDYRGKCLDYTVSKHDRLSALKMEGKANVQPCKDHDRV